MIAAAVVVGPPLAVLLWIRAARSRPPTAADLTAWIAQPQAAVAALIASIMVSVWLLLVFAIARRAWRAVRVAVRRARLPSAAQVTAGSVAGVAALAMPSVIVAHPAGAASVSTPSSPDLAVPDVGGVESGGVGWAGPQTAATRAGIELPGGGWVPYRTALAVSVLAGAIWLHRRHRYQPGGWRFGQHHRDPDLQPLPATTDAIIAEVDAPQPLEVGAESILPDLPAGLLTLHGPGAVSAARGLLITALLEAALADTAAQANAIRAEVRVRTADLHLLGISMSGDLPAGLSVGDAAASPSASPGDGERRRQPMLVINQHARARTAGGQYAAEDVDRVTTVVVGDGGHQGPRWHVGIDGSVIDGTEHLRRLCLLDQHAATDLLRLVQLHAATTASSADPRPGRHDHVSRPAQLHMLGGCRLYADGTAIHIRRSAGLQILAYLAIHSTGATTTDLVRAIWPGLDPNSISKRLHTTLTDLRHQLQPTLPDGIIRHDERYRLNPDTIQTDLDQLRRAVTAAAAAVTGPDRQRAARAVIDAYPGELAAGFSWPWLQPDREALRRDVIDAYLLLAAAAPSAEALDLLRAAMAVDPHNDALLRQAQNLQRSIGAADGAPTPAADVIDRGAVPAPGRQGHPPT